MQLRLAAATLAVASSLTVVSDALAAPATPVVRTEGYGRTLFEGPVRTEGHAIRAASDTQDRVCDGTNADANPAPGPTATTATADAMAIVGQDFDAQWYPSFQDYFLTRVGPDAETASAFWGVLVNRVFTPVGGCQFQVGDGDEVMWTADAFSGRPFLDLVAIGQPGTTVAVGVGADLVVRAGQTVSSGELEPGQTGPAVGVTVAPVSTAPNGFQTVETGAAAAQVTGADGRTTLSWATPGWKRVKATIPDGGDANGWEDAVRSNRLDVCVGECGPAPADTAVRQLAATPGPTPTASPTAAPAAPPVTTPAPTSPGVARIGRPRIVAGGAARGRVRVRFAVADAGPGIRGWTMASRTLPSRAWRTRASGTTATSADLRLPAGRTSEVRLTVTDAIGASATASAGRVLVPIDDRATAFRLRGRWTPAPAKGAWRGGVSTGRAGATAAVRLAAGRPRVVLGAGSRGTVRVRAGRVVRTVRVRRGATLALKRRPHAGTVTLQVLKGRVRLDGAAVAP